MPTPPKSLRPISARSECLPQAVFERADFERLAAALRTLQGRFIVSINDVPAIRETFDGFAMQQDETTYTIGSKGALGGRKELLIMGRSGE